MDYKTFVLGDLKYREERINWISRILYAMSGSDQRRPPVQFRGKARRRQPFLVATGRAIHFDDPETLKVLSYHQDCYGRYLKRAQVLYYLIYIIVAMALWASVSVLMYIGLRYLAIAVLLATYVITLIAAGGVVRIAHFVAGRYFAETLCVTAVLYVILELARDDVLLRSDRRISLLRRIEYLATNTLLLAWKYHTKDRSAQVWLVAHFKRIGQYIRERERWAIVPRETTLADLRRDFYNLASMYITGNYGNFVWPDVEVIPKALPPSWMPRVLRILPRLLGITLPLAILGLIIWQPNLLGLIGVRADIAALILVCWLLIAIDTTFKLGVIGGIVDFARGVRDLS